VQRRNPVIVTGEIHMEGRASIVNVVCRCIDICAGPSIASKHHRWC
jgi:hypothetical protein